MIFPGIGPPFNLLNSQSSLSLAVARWDCGCHGFPCAKASLSTFSTDIAQIAPVSGFGGAFRAAVVKRRACRSRVHGRLERAERKTARMLARALEAEAGDDPGPGPLTR